MVVIHNQQDQIIPTNASTGDSNFPKDIGLNLRMVYTIFFQHYSICSGIELSI